MTKLQELRLSRNLSQSELAKLSGVNVRTLQDFDQGRKSLANAKGEMIYRLSHALECTSDDLLSGYIDIQSNPDSYNSTQALRLNEYAKKLSIADSHYYGKYYTFPILEKRPGVMMQYIYPTKQRLVGRLYDALTPRKEVLSVMLFGSSISMRCTMDSDTDLSIRLTDIHNNVDVRNEISETVQEICDWNADIIWYDRITPDDRVYHDICKGVQIV